MELFYAHPTAFSGDEVEISGDEHHHLAHVLRKNEGDEVFLVDGLGCMYRSELARISKHETLCRITEVTHNFHERSVPLVLAQALLKQPSKMDWIVEKATELGATRIIPLITHRALVARGHEERWRRIALAAMKQSLRSLLPVIEPATRLDEAFRVCEGHRIFVCHEQAEKERRFRDEDRSGKSATAVFIGPEGGFTDEEIEVGLTFRAEIISLGVRRLRSETAALVALANLVE